MARRRKGKGRRGVIVKGQELRCPVCTQPITAEQEVEWRALDADPVHKWCAAKQPALKAVL